MIDIYNKQGDKKGLNTKGKIFFSNVNTLWKNSMNLSTSYPHLYFFDGYISFNSLISLLRVVQNS